MENILVIGGGLMGASAAWKLAERGAKVTLLEQQGENYANGSSYGNSRISRSLGPKKDVFSYAHNKTVKEVAKLISFLNEEETTPHTMEDVYTTSPVSYLFHKDQYAQIEKFKFKKQKKDFRMASSQSAFRKFGMTIPKNTLLLREVRQHSGTLNPMALIKKLKLGIEKKGGAIKYNLQVTKLVKKEATFEIEVLHTKTKKTQKLKAKKIVLAAGANTINILEEFAPYLNKVITPKKVVISYFKIKDERYQQLTEAEKKSILKAFPLFSQMGKEYYATIEKINETSSPVFKAGGHQMRRNIRSMNRVWTEEPRKKEVKWIKKQFRKHFDMLEIYLSKKDIEVTSSSNCVYTETRSKNPIVTNIFNQYGSLDHDIVVIGGMSGIGAKGCLCYGTLGADLMLGKAGVPNKMYRKMLQTFSNPSVNLYSKTIKRGRLF